jgi:hypothetical protein
MRYAISNPKLPLAVYREVAAHLSQVEGVTAELMPQTATQFDYTLSQVGELRIDCPAAAQAQVEKILAYYGNRFGEWSKAAPAL